MPDMPIIPIRAAVLRKPDRLLKICCTSVTSTKIHLEWLNYGVEYFASNINFRVAHLRLAAIFLIFDRQRANSTADRRAIPRNPS